MRKKAQIGTTLNWMLSTVIVFFVIFLFLIMVGQMTLLKNIPVVGKYYGLGKNEIHINGENVFAKDGEIQNDLHSYLNLNFMENERNMDFIELFGFNLNDVKYSEFEKYTLTHFTGIYNSCFHLCIVYYKNNEFLITKIIESDKCKDYELTCSDFEQDYNYASAEVIKEFSIGEEKMKVNIGLHKELKDE